MRRPLSQNFLALVFLLSAAEPVIAHKEKHITKEIT